MADSALSLSRDAVLKESASLPEDMPRIRGYDFNQGVDHRALLHSYLTTGFQASSFALAVQEINKMVSSKDVSCFLPLWFFKSASGIFMAILLVTLAVKGS